MLVDNTIHLCVVGAHLQGQPLNHQLTDLKAIFVETVRTASFYRFFALRQTEPPKPGMVRDNEFEGPGIEGEIWSLTPNAFGTFVANVPPPLVIGTVVLNDQREVKGFLAEPHALVGATDISHLGSWRAYVSE